MTPHRKSLFSARHTSGVVDGIDSCICYHSHLLCQRNIVVELFGILNQVLI